MISTGALRRSFRNEKLQAFLVLFGIFNLAFFPALWGDRTLMTSAATVASVMPWGACAQRPASTDLRSADPAAPGWQFEPAVAFQHRELLQGHFPSWNPYAGYGAPWAANMQPQPLFPLTFLVALHPSPKTVSWFVVARLVLGGWFAYLFFRRLTSHAASMVGALVFALQGYFTIHLNIDHLSTDVLIPMVFWAFEGLVRNHDARSRWFAALAVFLAIISGMPECTFLVLVFGWSYFLFRLGTDPEARARARERLVDFAGVNAIGFAAAAFMLVPFLEFLRNGIDSHRSSFTGVVTGVLRGPDVSSDLLYLLPYAFGPFSRNIFTGYKGFVPIWNCVGTGAAVLAVYAIASCLRLPRAWRLPQWISLFFGLAFTVMMLKHHGHPLVNWIGRLPLFDLVLYPKYLQPLIGFALAGLACCGAAELFGGRVGPVRAALGPVAVLAVILAFAETLRPALRGLPRAGDFYAGLVCGLAFLLVFGAAATWCSTRAQRPGGAGTGPPAVVGTLAAMEMLAGFLIPTTYYFGVLPPATCNPYQGAPYVRFLQDRSRDGYRVFGQDAYLHPGWASAFGLYDVRYLYGMNYDRFMRFIQALLAPPGLGLHGDLADRFDGTGYPYATTEPEQKRFLQLSSIRYLVRWSYIASQSALITEALRQDSLRSERTLVRKVFALGGQARDVLFQHPPNRTTVRLTVPEQRPTLAFTPAIDPELTPGCGDGVGFNIEIESSRGIEPLYRKYIDPKAAPAAQRWNDDLIDLRAYAGQSVSLVLSTDGGPRGDTACDWAGWGGLRMLGSAAEGTSTYHRAFRLVYDAEAKIFEFDESLPRAAVFSGATLAAGPDQALARIKDPSLDVWRTVVVERQGLDGAAQATLAEIASRPAEMARPATIESYDSQRVVIRAETSRPGVLLLTDSNYPGWKVSVDGKPARLLAANYLFRGVLLPAGTHRVEFRYAPASYRWGTAMSLAALGALGIWSRRRRRRPGSEPPDGGQDAVQRPQSATKLV